MPDDGTQGLYIAVISVVRIAASSAWGNPSLRNARNLGAKEDYLVKKEMP